MLTVKKNYADGEKKNSGFPVKWPFWPFYFAKWHPFLVLQTNGISIYKKVREQNVYVKRSWTNLQYWDCTWSCGLLTHFFFPFLIGERRQWRIRMETCAWGCFSASSQFSPPFSSCWYWHPAGNSYPASNFVGNHWNVVHWVCKESILWEFFFLWVTDSES